MWKKTGDDELDGRLVGVLEVDPDLGADLDPDSLASASAELIAPVALIDWATNRGR